MRVLTRPMVHQWGHGNLTKPRDLERADSRARLGFHDFELATDPTDGRQALLDAGRNLAEIYVEHGRLLAAFADAAAFSPDVDGASQLSSLGDVASASSTNDKLTDRPFGHRPDRLRSCRFVLEDAGPANR